MAFGRPRLRYEGAPFWLWHADEENLESGQEVGAVDVAGLDGVLQRRGTLNISLDPRLEPSQWFAEWEHAQRSGDAKRVLVLFDRRGKRWVKLTAFISSANLTSDVYALQVTSAEILGEPPLLVES